MVHELAKRDDRVVFIGSDLSPGLLADMKKELPHCHYMEGVSEALVVGMAAGMALDGFIPYINTIANFFTRRALEQIAIDLCLHDLPVRLIANGGGLIYAPLGPTHQATDDFALMRALSNMTIVVPADAAEMKRFMEVSVDWPHPIYIRLGDGRRTVIPDAPFEIGKGYHVRKAIQAGGPLLIGTGIGTVIALDAAEQMDVDVLHLPTVKPLDEDMIIDLGRRASVVVTIEEHSCIGGLGSAVTDLFAREFHQRLLPPIHRVALPDAFMHDYGTQESLLKDNGVSVEAVLKLIGG